MHIAVPDLAFEAVPENEQAQFGRSPPGRGIPHPRDAPTLPTGAQLPQNPPFKAYVRNLPNGVTVEDLRHFFVDLQVTQPSFPPNQRRTENTAGLLPKCFPHQDTGQQTSLWDSLCCRNAIFMIPTRAHGCAHCPKSLHSVNDF